MNRKLYALLLPVIGGAVIVGSGFSAWYFNTTSISNSLGGNGTVEGLVTNAGTIEFTPTAFDFNLDQGGRGNINYNEGITLNESGEPVTSIEQLQFTFTGDAYYEESFFNQYGETKTLNYQFTIELSSTTNGLVGEDGYIGFDCNSTGESISTANEVVNAYTFTVPATDDDAATVVTRDIVALAYRKKPTDANAYRTMIDTFNGSAPSNYSQVFEGLELTIKVTVELVEKEV